jgi:hypothetical protein
VKNVTVSLDEETALWLRIRAAQEDLSVSRFLAGLLLEKRREEEVYQQAKAKALSVEPTVLRDRPGDPLPRRSDLYDR